MDLGITTSVARSTRLGLAADGAERSRVLFLAAEPNVRALMDPYREARTIAKRLAATGANAHLDLVTTRAPKLDDVVDLMLRHRPRVVHIAGHCTRDGALVLADTATALALLEIFRQLRGRIECVFINAGRTAELASALAEHVDCAIGVQGTWSPRAGLLMSEYFYGGVGQAQPVGQAFEVGKLALSLHDCDEHDAPRLYMRRGTRSDRLVLSR